MTGLEQSVALVTDAGTPGISDPGFELVAAAVQAGVTVAPIPGASAVLSALTASGLPTARFLFEGFLPRTRSSRVDKLKALASESRTLIFFESPQRLGPTLAEMLQAFGDRPACVAREITKKFEEFRRSGLRELAAVYSGEPPRGECVIVIHGLADDALQELPAEPADPGSGRNDLLKLLASEMGVNRRELYQAILRLRRKE
jgi:16S rRNA (cytidine1402-2'-O)-methyltransferase